MISHHHRIWLTALAAAWISTALVACGGKVVADQGGALGGGGGAGGAGGATTTTGIGGFGGLGGAGGCEGLTASLDAKIAAAQACNPYINTIQCSGVVTTVDLCGCPIVANDGSAAAAASADAAFDAWVNAGCGPFECYACPPPPSSPWYCDPTAGVCMPAYEK